MAVAVLQNFGPGEPDVYDKLSQELDASAFNGLLFHWAGHVDGNWRVTDVWESEELHKRFVDEHLMPALHKVTDGQPGDPPDTRVVDVYAYRGEAIPASR